MHSAVLLAITAVPFAVAALLPGSVLPGSMLPGSVLGNEVTRFQDPEIVESSGLAVVDGLFVTTNDSGDQGRLFSVDPATGETVAVTHWSAEPDDVEALAPTGGGAVWVGDIGDNGADRDSVSVTLVQVDGGTGAPVPSYELVYPEGARDAESLLADPADGRLYIASKGLLGGVLYAAPRQLSPDAANRLKEVGPVLPIATDAAFFPDGRHVIARSYSEAAVYSWPDLTQVGRFGLPHQELGEGIAVADDGTIYASSEGLHAPVLRIALPDVVRRAMQPASPSPSPAVSPGPTQTTTPTESLPPGTRVGEELPEQPASERPVWGWAVGGLVGLGIVLVLVRALRPR